MGSFRTAIGPRTRKMAGGSGITVARFTGVTHIRDAYRRNWRYVPQFFYGTESWIGNIFSPDESANVIGDNVGDLYSLEYFERVTAGQLAAWRLGA